MMTRLIRPRTERMIAGVCGGLGLYFGIDPVIVRLVFVVLALTQGIGLLLYPVLWLVIPGEQWQDPLPPDARFDPQTGQPLPERPPVQPVSYSAPVHHSRRRGNLALVLLGIGGALLLSNVGEVFHVNIGDLAFPLLLIGFGFYILRGQRQH